MKPKGGLGLVSFTELTGKHCVGCIARAAAVSRYAFAALFLTPRQSDDWVAALSLVLPVMPLTVILVTVTAGTLAFCDDIWSFATYEPWFYIPIQYAGAT